MVERYVETAVGEERSRLTDGRLAPGPSGTAPLTCRILCILL